MELLKDYSSSDGSDYDAYDLHAKNYSTVSSVDYFNLNSSDSESNSNSAAGPSGILSDFDLIGSAMKLDKVQGPIPQNEINLAVIKPNKQFLKDEIQNDFKNCTKEKSCTSLNVTETRAYNEIQKINQDTVNEILGSDIAGTKSMHNVFYINPKISYYKSKELHCTLPKKQIKSYKYHESAVTALSWSVPHYSHLLLSGSFDKTLKIYDIFNNSCLRVIKTNFGIKAAQWSLCGKLVIFGGFGNHLQLYDIDTNKELSATPVKKYVTCISIHPYDSNLFLVGSQSKIILFDKRECSPVRTYEENFQSILDIAFINNGQEFVCSTDVVTRDSADKTIMVWDFTSGALLSNQVYHERYTCPSLKPDPHGQNFVAQSSGDYIVSFSTVRPYKMRKNTCYMGHKVSGYSINCDFSPDGKFLASGDAEGGLYFYNYFNETLVNRLTVNSDTPTVRVCWHPVLFSTVAAACWDGSIRIYQ